MKVYLHLALIGGGLGLVGLAQANLLSDGSFETPTISPGSENVVSGGDSIGPWSVVGNNVLTLSTTSSESNHGVSFNAEDGLVSVDLTGASNTGPTDGISQSFVSTNGASYSLSFWVGAALSDNGFSGYQTPATIGLSIDGGAQTLYTSLATNSGGINWTEFTVGIVATGSSTNIAFFNDTTLATDEAGLDNVSVTPEPAPFAILGLGLLAVTRRKRKS